MKTDRLPSLDGFRALSVAMVLGNHAGLAAGMAHWSSPLIPNWVLYLFFSGGLGVLVFFVISGYLITTLLVREEAANGAVDLRAFYIRRSFRILPVFLAFMLVLVALNAFIGLGQSARLLLSAAFLVRDFYPLNLQVHDWYTTHTWSLAVEEQFYLLWPLVLVFAPRRYRKPVAIACIAAAPVFRVALHLLDAGRLQHYSFFSAMDALMIGCLAAMLTAEKPDLADRVLRWRTGFGRSIAWVMLFAAGLPAVLDVLAQVAVPFAPSVQALAACYLICSYATVREGVVYKVLNARPIAYVGVLSYSIYIWQQLFLVEIGEAARTPWGQMLPGFPFNLLLVLGVAAFSYHLIEMPMLSLRKRFLGHSSAPVRAGSVPQPV